MSFYVENDGSLIVTTNFWETAAARDGKLLVSCNAGAFRVLLPEVLEPVLPDMEAARQCAISRGPMWSMGLADCFEILFDDHTDNPYTMFLSASSFDRLPPASDAGRWFLLTAWTNRCGAPWLAMTRPCYYRVVDRLPCQVAAPPAPPESPSK